MLTNLNYVFHSVIQITKVPKIIVPLNEKVNILFSKSINISQRVSRVLQMYHNAKNCFKFTKEILQIPYSSNQRPSYFPLAPQHSKTPSLLCSWPGRMNLHRSWPRFPNWVLEMEVTGTDLKAEGGQGRERPLPPCLPQSQLPWALLHKGRSLLCSSLGNSGLVAVAIPCVLHHPLFVP